jgi:hypothetical protein
MGHQPYSELATELRRQSRRVEPGTVWCHYKGADYQIDNLVIMEASDSVGVIYHEVNHSEVHFCCDIISFLGLVEFDGQQETRFSLKSDEN